MPKTRTRSSRSNVRSVSNAPNINGASNPLPLSPPEDLEQLYTSEMRNLCLNLRLPTRGSRRTLKTRLLKEKACREQEVTVEEPSTTATCVDKRKRDALNQGVYETLVIL